MPFENSITGGQGALIRPAIKSPNFVTGVSGWSINRDGSAEFNNVVVRGTVVAGAISAGSIGSSNIVNSNFNGGTINQSTITFDNTGGVLFVYSTTTVVTTFNSGSGNFANPAGITSLQVECWGGGAGGAAGNAFAGGGGSGGGEYAADFAVAVTPSTNYAYAVGAAGSGGVGGAGTDGGNSTFTGNSVTVTAHGGTHGLTASGGGNGGAGGTGSTNSVHFNGGSGGNGGIFSVNGGGGGGSGGTSANGNAGASGDSTSAGGAAVTGGGAGGNGGVGAVNGSAGSAPGGAGGGAGDSTNGGAGAAGRVRITYVSARTLVAAISPASGTDSFGTAYPAGISGIEAGVDYVRLGSNGNLEYGASGSAADTNLFRNAANVLRTNDDLTVDGTLTNTGVAALRPKFYEGVCSTATTVGTSLADVTGATVTFSTTYANATVLVVWTADHNITGAGAGVVAIAQMNYDGTDVNTRQALMSLDDVHRITVTQRDNITLVSAGSHTIKMRCQKTGAGGTDQLQTNHTGFTLVVFDNPY